MSSTTNCDTGFSIRQYVRRLNGQEISHGPTRNTYELWHGLSILDSQSNVMRVPNTGVHNFPKVRTGLLDKLGNLETIASNGTNALMILKQTVVNKLEQKYPAFMLMTPFVDNGEINKKTEQMTNIKTSRLTIRWSGHCLIC